MKTKAITHGLLYVLFLIVLFSCAQVNTTIENLTVDYTTTPLGIDVNVPIFSWQMNSPSNERGYYQRAYQIIVTNPDGNVVWNSEKVEDANSVGVKYEGSQLRATTKYEWSVSVWDQNDEIITATSWFETGLMSTDLSAWSGAKWIGGGDDDLVFYSHYQIIYRFKYSLEIPEGSTKAGFIYGANDIRLKDKYRNIYQLENGENESYFKLEFDISNVDELQREVAKLNVYRVGYSKDDIAGEPIKTYNIKPSVVNFSNKNEKHNFEIRSAYGRIDLSIDGISDFFIPEEQAVAVGGFGGGGARGAASSVNLNPVGSGHNYIPFGMVCDIGFAVDPNQRAYFSDIEIYNDRAPNNTLFKEDLSTSYNGIYTNYISENRGISISDNSFVINGGENGLLITADPSRNSSPLLRTEFITRRDRIKDARLYVTARGIYEIFLNGDRIGDDYYNPDLTQYNKTHMYQTYDVTSMVKNGENAMGAMLAEGWWSGMLSFGDIWNHFGDRQSLLAKLVIDYTDGSQEIITTDPANWKYYNNGPIVYSSLNMGEVYDANKESNIDGWLLPNFDDTQWKKTEEILLSGTSYSGVTTGRDGVVTSFDFDDMELIGQIGNNAKIYETLTAKSVEEVRPGVYVYDMGQNFVGVPKITFSNGNQGDTIILRVAEMLYPDLEESGDNVGMIMLENYRAALCQDIYIMKNGRQTFQPKFTSRGYQYIEVTGIDSPLPLEAVQGVAISSITELTADYNTSNRKVNQLWSNLTWSNIDNFLSVPTDCPQRNERMGWGGDINVFSRTATYASNSSQFLRRHLLAMRDMQGENGRFTDIAPIGGGFGGVLWGSAGITVPWEVYLQYNDKIILEEQYPAMVKYIDYIETTIDPQTGLSTDGQLGDWLGPQNNQLGSAFLATAYHAYDLWIVANVAEILNKTEDAERFREMYYARKEFFNETFVNDDYKTLGYVSGTRVEGQPAPSMEFKIADTQTSYAVGLALNLFNEENTPYMISNLADAVKRQNRDDDGVLRPEYSLMTGFIGTAWISKTLSDNGYSDVAYRLLQNNQYPSWLYSIDQGATTIWERLNGYTVENGFGGNNSMNSFNHYSFGAVGQWMIAYSLGIQRQDPGFKRFILQPEPDLTGEMKWAEGHYDSMYGRIYSKWELNNGVLNYNAIVPANTTATLYLPSNSIDSVKEGGNPISESIGITFVKYEDGKAIYELQSGSYRFETVLK